MGKLRIASFNCRSIKSSLIDLAKVCDGCDIVLLQETWLRSFELNLINSVHADFEGRAWSAMNNSNGLIGRPYGGLAVIWRKSLNVNCCIKCSFVHDRIVVMDICNGKRSICLVNVYMPVAGGLIEQKEEYLNMLGLISNTLSNVCTDNNIIVMGDFNASGYNGYISLVDDFCSEEGFVIADMQKLCADSYTYERYPGGPKS
jgi:exonuclease III